MFVVASVARSLVDDAGGVARAHRGADDDGIRPVWGGVPAGAQDGKLVGSGKGSMIVSGANAPAIQKVIKEHIPVIVKEEEEEAA